MPPSPPHLPPFPSAPPPTYTCACAPAAVNGSCAAGSAVLNYMLDPTSTSETPYQQCIDTLAFDSVNGAYTFDFCWRTGCLPSQFAAAPFSVFADNMLIPGAASLAAGAVSVVLMKPTCATLSASGSPSNDTSAVIDFCQNCITELPASGVNDISVVAYAPVGCDDQYVSALLLQLPMGTDPVALESHCPCWEVPAAGGACSGIKVPITLTTTDEDEAGTSFRQCIDPANFDAATGQMAFSYCWRYACLPDAFTHSNFNATVTKLQRYNINQMPGGLWNTTFHRTDGVSILVTADPKPTSSFPNATVPAPFTFNDSGIVTFPTNGIFDMTFVFQIPVGYDDLSASIQMFGPPPPPSPPKAVQCACNDRPFAGPNGALTCLDYQTLVYVEREDGLSNDTQCITVSNYDIYLKSYAFSECWRYACQPDDFYGYAYTLTVLGMTKYNINLIPAGQVTLFFQRPYLETFNMSLTANFADGTHGTYTSANIASSMTSEVMTVPVGGITSVDIKYYVPFDMTIDDNSAAIVFNPIPGPPGPPAPPLAPPSPMAPPNPPPHPPLPPGAKSFQQGTIVSAFFYTLGTATTQASLQALMSSYAASLKANVTMYTVTLPTTFPNFGVVADCSPNATAAFLVKLGSSLGLSPSVMQTSCKLGNAVATSGRRLSAATLTMTTTVNTTTPADTGAAATTALNNIGGTTGDPTYGTFFTLQRVLLSVSDAASVQSSQCSSIVNAASAAYSGVSQTSACVSAANIVAASADGSSAVPVPSTSTPPSTVTARPPTTATGTPSPPPVAAASSFPLTAVVAGVVGGVVGLALLVGGGMYVKKKRQGSAAASSEQGLTKRFKSYTDERSAVKAATAVTAAQLNKSRAASLAVPDSAIDAGAFHSVARPPSRDAWSDSPTAVRSPGALPTTSADDVIELNPEIDTRPSPNMAAQRSMNVRSPAVVDNSDPMLRPSVTAWSSFTNPNGPRPVEGRPGSAGSSRPGSAGDQTGSARPGSAGGLRVAMGEGGAAGGSPRSSLRASEPGVNRSASQRISDGGLRIAQSPGSIAPSTPNDDVRLPAPPAAGTTSIYSYLSRAGETPVVATSSSPQAGANVRSYFARAGAPAAPASGARPPSPAAAAAMSADEADAVLRI